MAPPQASPPPSPHVPPTIPDNDGTPTSAADVDPASAAHANAIADIAGGSDNESDDLDDDESQPLLTARKRRGSNRRRADDSGVPLHLSILIRRF